jgi:thioredoxin reductase
MKTLSMHDAIVVGGSFAGLSAALQLARARRQVVVIDSGEPRNRFARAAHGFFGQDGRTSAAILTDGRARLLTYPTAMLIQAVARFARKTHEGFEVEIGSGERLQAKRLILATGVKDHLPEVRGLRERWGVTVLHCPYCHGYEVAGTRLGVLATSTAAVKQALLVSDWGKVILLTNGAIQIDNDAAAKLQKRDVSIETVPVEALVGDAPERVAISLQDGRSIQLDALYTTTRISMASPLAEQLGCGFEHELAGPFIRTDAFKETSVRGVYAAGDAARPTHNSTWASADGVTAGMFAHQSIILGEPLCEASS